MIILGIDPGSRITGYGLVSQKGSKSTHIDNGGIFAPKTAPLSERIHFIHEKVAELIELHKPHLLALENIFVAKNVKSAMILGHARGAIMLAADRHQVPIYEYTPTQVKLALTGQGRASKEQIQKMTRMLLNLKEICFEDAADALAVAICHGQSYKLMERISLR
ncbi:MAG: crossover junction endodeoxyribonuclease RuvC [Deltaproteobacteria bacterium CG11_big_fil_rev_8_21_14_0_20_42_23]|nr:MAG: crossover junction endodeoxyribonuclease RuvC [Deltaproteobacteria bacterium CG11_big_fil_rev_8_21_14_0_20_42_23]PJC64257.1 MAG: crossover junction endodeoxyribonuclease RuvC [Deltaproteobacteria bacterium CG_4_9_14_0_2_um_filter_42_21]